MRLFLFYYYFLVVFCLLLTFCCSPFHFPTALSFLPKQFFFFNINMLMGIKQQTCTILLELCHNMYFSWLLSWGLVYALYLFFFYCDNKLSLKTCFLGKSSHLYFGMEFIFFWPASWKMFSNSHVTVFSTIAPFSPSLCFIVSFNPLFSFALYLLLWPFPFMCQRPHNNEIWSIFKDAAY